MKLLDFVQQYDTFEINGLRAQVQTDQNGVGIYFGTPEILDVSIEVEENEAWILSSEGRTPIKIVGLS